MEVVVKTLISLAIAGAGVYVLIHSKSMARGLQNLYVQQAEKKQAQGGFRAYLFMYNPETWKTPFATFLFRAGMIFLGFWLILVAYPIVFGAIQL